MQRSKVPMTLATISYSYPASGGNSCWEASGEGGRERCPDIGRGTGNICTEDAAVRPDAGMDVGWGRGCITQHQCPSIRSDGHLQ